MCDVGTRPVCVMLGHDLCARGWDMTCVFVCARF